MDIREARDLTATVAPFVGDGVDEDLRTATKAILGAGWTATITSVNPHGTSGPIVVRVKSSTLNGPNFPSPIGGRLNEFLIGGPLLAIIAGTHNGVTGSITPQTIPKEVSLLCIPWAAQGTIVGGGFADLTIAVAGVTGTQ